MPRILLLLTLFSLIGLQAAVNPGENLLVNGQLDAEDINQATGLTIKTPEGWSTTGNPRMLSFDRKGSPTGHGVVKFSCPLGENSSESTVRQGPLKLKAKGKYRISALIRTKDFQSKHGGLIIIDNGWFHSCGIKEFPVNQDWTPMSQEFTLMESANDDYNFVMYVTKFTGSIEIADVKLEAVSDDALAGSSISDLARLLTAPMLMPWEPILNGIPRPLNGDAPVMSFRFAGHFADNSSIEDYDIRYSVDNGAPQTVPLQKGINPLKLNGRTQLGDFPLKVAVVNRKNGDVKLENSYTATLIDVPEINAADHRRLNNLVVEILNKPLAKTAAAQSFEFSTFRNGWIFITAADENNKDLQVVLDDSIQAITSASPRHENVRDVLRGRHKLTVTGAVNGGTIIVRSIPEIYNYCPGINSGVNENPPYNWEFQKKYVLPNITTENGGNVPPEVRKDFYAAGYKWIANLGTTKLKNGDDLVERLGKCAGMNAPEYQGVSCDEQFFNQLNSILPYTDGIKKFVPQNDHIIYTWITSTPSLQGAHHDFITACINASHGRGRLISEVYCRTQPTLQKAKDYLEDVIVQKTMAYKSFYPNILNHWGIILGNFNQVPILSLAHHPNVDYKYYLDLQFNYLANHPECKDMAITGYWGSYYADHELHRWSFMLTRHYCIEGKKTMLSDEYGFAYDPAHIVNGDFDKAFTGWTVNGTVRNDKFANYASRSQNRWGGNGGQGDTFAVFSKKQDDVSTVTQTAKGLIPGKLYCLQFSTADFNDVKQNKLNPRLYGIDVALGDGAAVQPNLSWVHVDKREKGRYAHNNGVARCNLHHIVFKATAPTTTLTFSNAKALPGEELGLNYIMLNPYLGE